MYAVAEIAGKQYICEEGKTIQVDKLDVADGDVLDIDTICLVRKDTGDVVVGTPYVSGAVVKASIAAAEEKGKKVIIFTYRKRKDSQRKKGHRQKYSLLKIEKIQQA
jgi:large subunit ribosomal protein L21